MSIDCPEIVASEPVWFSGGGALHDGGSDLRRGGGGGKFIESGYRQIQHVVDLPAESLRDVDEVAGGLSAHPELRLDPPEETAVPERGLHRSKSDGRQVVSKNALSLAYASPAHNLALVINAAKDIFRCSLYAECTANT